MKILIDTREQRPLDFELGEILTEIKRATLPVADYVAQYSDGSICPIYFERKSIADLFGTLTSGHKRFKAELARAKDMNVRIVLAIEGTVRDVLAGSEYSSVSGDTILKKLMTLWLRYDLTPMFFRNREEMSRAITEFYLAFGRNYKLKEK